MDEMRTHVTEEDEGKHVVDADGTELGVITEVDGRTAHVDVDPGITDRIKSKLGWGDEDDTYAISEDRIAEITDAEVRVREL